MAKINNNGNGGSSGHGQVDPKVQPPGVVYTDPGARNLNDADWVRRDVQYKESLPQQKFY